MTVFETERLIVHRYNENEQDNFFLLNGNIDVMRYIRPVKSRKESDQFFTEVLAGYYTQPGLGRWAVTEKQTGDFIGSFAIIPIPNHTELIQLGYALRKEHWGKGFATELTIAGLKYAFEKLKLDVIYGITEKENFDSQKVLLKAGFKKQPDTEEEGKTICWFVYYRTDWISS